MVQFLEELNANNSSNYKLSVLEKHKDNEFIKMFLKLTYDKVNYIYGVKKIPEFSKSGSEELTFAGKDIETLNKLNERKLTGNKAIEAVKELFESLTEDSQHMLKCILDRDIHCGISTKQINKIFKNLIPEFPYMRCSLQDKLKNIEYPAILQLKADGTYRTFIKKGDDIRSFSRDGKEYTHPKIIESLKNLNDGVYIGELICNNIEGENSTEIRYKSNGLLNSLTPPDDVTFFIWDYLTNDEFKGNKKSPIYIERFNIVKKINDANIKPIKSIIVNSYEEAQEKTKEWIDGGSEGSILKNFKAFFKNGTSTEQIKIKPEIEVEVRCVGFTKGNGKFKDTFGAIEFKTDDDMIQGQVSGISDSERFEISNNREKYLNKVFTVKATEVTKSKDSNFYALMHPRFNGFREDKDYTDDLERILKM